MRLLMKILSMITLWYETALQTAGHRRIISKKDSNAEHLYFILYHSECIVE